MATRSGSPVAFVTLCAPSSPVAKSHRVPRSQHLVASGRRTKFASRTTPPATPPRRAHSGRGTGPAAARTRHPHRLAADQRPTRVSPESGGSVSSPSGTTSKTLALLTPPSHKGRAPEIQRGRRRYAGRAADLVAVRIDAHRVGWATESEQELTGPAHGARRLRRTGSRSRRRAASPLAVGPHAGWARLDHDQPAPRRLAIVERAQTRWPSSTCRRCRPMSGGAQPLAERCERARQPSMSPWSRPSSPVARLKTSMCVSLPGVEHAADADDGRALLGRHLVVLAGAHRQVPEVVTARPPRLELVAQLAERREPRPRRLGSSANGGIVISRGRPRAPSGSTSARKPSTSPRPTPALVSSPATLTCSRQATGCCERVWIWPQADSESTAWISRTRPTISRTLRLWTWPMKSQVNRSPNRSCFASSASDRFSPTSRRRPRPAPAGRPARRTWWRPGSRRRGRPAPAPRPGSPG